MGRLTEDQSAEIAATPEEVTGNALDKVLAENHGIMPFTLLVEKSRALGFAPCNVARCRVKPASFERLPQDFCEEHLVLPVGEVGGGIVDRVCQSVR